MDNLDNLDNLHNIAYEDMRKMSHAELSKINVQNKKMRAQKDKMRSRYHMTTLLRKKFGTTIIGSLAAFEDNFGHLWAHGTPLDELDEAQMAFRDVWEEVRKDILDKGNTQLRAALEEINNYDLDWKKYQTQLLVKPQD